MNRPSVLNSPLLVGFDHLERVLEHVAKTSGEGYPPYNIEQTGTHRLRITLAVAGFAIDDLTVSLQERQLTVRGRKREDGAGRVFLYRGIASRQFQRAFVLAEGIEIEGATLDNGLLHIDLHRVVPEPAVKTIPISKGAPAVARPLHTIDVTRDE